MIWELILFAIIISLIEAYSLHCCKRYNYDRKYATAIKAMFSYCVIVLLVSHLMNTSDIIVINSLWNGISIILSGFMGYIIYNEMLTHKQMIGIFLILAGCYFSC